MSIDCSSAAAGSGLEQALLNLMANAIKFNRTGGEVRVSARKLNGQVAIQITIRRRHSFAGSASDL